MFFSEFNIDEKDEPVDLTNSERTFNASASFEFKIYYGAKWGYDVRFLFFHLSDSFNFMPDKVLYGYRTGERIIEAKPPTTDISIDENGLDLGASNYLLYDVFEPNKFAVTKAKLIKPTSVVQKEYGALVNIETTTPMLSFRFTDNSGNLCNYLRLVGDRLSVDKEAPIDFSCKMIVTSFVGNDDKDFFLCFYFDSIEEAEKFNSKNNNENLGLMAAYGEATLGKNLKPKQGSHNNVAYVGSETSFEAAF